MAIPPPGTRAPPSNLRYLLYVPISQLNGELNKYITFHLVSLMFRSRIWSKYMYTLGAITTFDLGQKKYSRFLLWNLGDTTYQSFIVSELSILRPPKNP